MCQIEMLTMDGERPRAHHEIHIRAPIEEGVSGVLYGKWNPETGFHYAWAERDPYAKDEPVAQIFGSEPNQSELDALALPIALWWANGELHALERTGETYEALNVEFYEDDLLYSRNGGLVSQMTLREKHVVISGCGSVGSGIAILLARAGVERFTLIDDDVVEMHNLSRTYDRSLLGQYKTHALAQSILAVNDCCEVTTYELRIENVSDEAFYASMEPGKTLLIAAADSRAADAYCNTLCSRCGVDMLASGFWPMAAVCEFFVYRAGMNNHTVQCVFAEQVQRDALAQHMANYAVNDGVQRVVQPGLGANVAFGNAVAAQLALDLLLKDEEGYHQRLLAYMPSQYMIISLTHLAEVGGPNVAALFKQPLQVLCPRIHVEKGCTCCQEE